MSKLSVRPDSSSTTPLRPTTFPLDLSKFKVSSSSTVSKPPTSPTPPPQKLSRSPLQPNLQFVTKPQTLPNLFQYNDRSRLLFSSDEEDQQQESKLQATSNKKVQLKELEIDYAKEKKGISREDQLEDREPVQSPKFNLRSDSKTNFKEKAEEQTMRKQDRAEPQGNIVEEQLFLSKSYQVGKTEKRKGRPKSRQIIENRSNQEHQKPPEEVKKEIYDQHQKEEQHSISIARGGISRTQIREDSTIKSSRYENGQSVQFQEEMSKTDAILERIQTEQKAYIVPSESEKHLEPISQVSVLLMTPRRKRNKIFDQSVKRDRSYLSSSKKEHTPSKQVQTESRHVYRERQEHSQSRVDRTPQVKALNILDKLVDQIGNETHNSKSRHFCQDDMYSSRAFASLSEFNQLCLEQLSRIQSITDISMIGEPAIYCRVETTLQKITMWRERIASSLTNIAFTNTVEYELIKRFQKISDLIDLGMKVSVAYRRTSERLTILQKKLQDYVSIMQEKDSKRLYLLIKDLNLEIDLMKQLRAGCGKNKLESMMAQYLSNEIALLEEVKEDLQ